MLRFFFLFCCSLISLYGDAPKKPVRVYADIVGDLFHAGHVQFFKQARALGDELIIGVLSDATVETYKRTPVLTLSERAEVIAACRYVDGVILDPPLRLTKEWILEHGIDIVVHGDDFSEETILDQYGVSRALGILRIVPYTKGISTTDIISRVASRNEEFVKLLKR